MPTYSFACSGCGSRADEMRSIAHCSDPAPNCCGRSMDRIYQFYTTTELEPYKSVIDGTIIKNRHHHREHLKEHGCVEIGTDTSFLNKTRPLQGDFNVRKELSQAVEEVLFREAIA